MAADSLDLARGESKPDFSKTESIVARTPAKLWTRFAVLWVACSIASGLLPGQSLFVPMFADAGVYGAICKDHDRHDAQHGDRSKGKKSHKHKDDDDGNAAGDCKEQFLAITAVFQTGSVLAVTFLAPIGVLYDRWGAQKTGTFGAVLCSLGLLGVWAAVAGASAGYDQYTSWVFVAGILACDFGSMLNSFSFYGMIWHFPGNQAFVLSLINATYQVGAFLPLLFGAMMDKFGLPLSDLLLGYAIVVAGVIVVCWKLVPTQEEYYKEAKRALGMPLPRPPKELNLWNMFSRAWLVLRQNTCDHVMSGISICFAYCLPSMYAALAAPYGEALFGTKADGKWLAEMFVSCNGLVGLALSPLSGVASDYFGFNFFIVSLGLVLFVASATLGIPDRRAQTVCAVCLVFWMSVFNLFISRYLLKYSPPNRFGTVQGVYVFVLMTVSAPLTMISLGSIEVLPEGPNAYRIPMWTSGITGALCMVVYACYYIKNPPPEVPHLLPDDEEELARGFGCKTLDEVLEVVGIATRKELVQKLASTNPEVMHSLIKSIDTQKMMEMMSKRSVEDIARMMEEGGGEGDEDEEEEEEEAEEEGVEASLEDGLGVAPSDSSRVPLLEAATPRKGAADERACCVQCGRDVGSFMYCGSCGRPVSRPRPPAESSPTASTVASPTASPLGSEVAEVDNNVEAAAPLLEATKEKTAEDLAKDLTERWQAMVKAKDGKALSDTLLTEDVDVMWNAMVYMEESMPQAEYKQMDKEFNKLVPAKEFARLLRERKELRSLVQKSMKREVERTMNKFRKKKKA
eukprot:TRINITY_DN3688_c3_g1_i1.p1 TRINITY_DN3688_c3_g1~~TRINITY_DN3688_c3_g1_i1.p1  ORF type:complete len:799 (-),score=199.56 TRINITY_DN3688_c3_g1_i1:131-2527(-)